VEPQRAFVAGLPAVELLVLQAAQVLMIQAVAVEGAAANVDPSARTSAAERNLLVKGLR
jgi:hypothetical protein